MKDKYIKVKWKKQEVSQSNNATFLRAEIRNKVDIRRDSDTESNIGCTLRKFYVSFLII